MNFQDRLQSTSIALLSFLVFISGCTSPGNSLPSAESTSIQSIKAPTEGYVMETEVPVKVETLIPTSTASLISSAASLPVPTLPPEEALEVVVKLLKSNNDYLLPCWWGICPGVTTWEEAWIFLSQFDSDIYTSGASEELLYAYVQVPGSPEITSLGFGSIDLTIKAGVVQDITAYGFSRAPAYRIDQLLHKVGIPDEVWINTFSSSWGGNWPFVVVLYYAEQGILASYSTEAELDGENIRGCLERSPSLRLWSPQGDLTFDEAAALFGWDISGAPYSLLEDVSAMDIEAFYYTFSDTSSFPCINTPRAFWPAP